MSTKPAITEGHISSRQEATSSRVIRVAVICALLAGAALLALALLAAVGGGAVAAPYKQNKNAPQANNGSVSTKEDEAALITLVATDRNGDALSYQITSLPTHGKLYKGNSTAAADEITNTSLPFTLPNSGNQVKYVPNANYNNTPDDDPDNFTFQAKDSKRTSNSATISIRVDPVNDPPVVDLDSEDRVETGIDTTVLFTEHFTSPGFPPGGVPKVLAPRTTVSDIDDTILESAEIKLTNRPDGNDESLSMDLEVLRGTSIDSLGYDPETGILALFGPDTLANFQKVLRTVSYDNREALQTTATAW
jgi:hypothetical protein